MLSDLLTPIKRQPFFPKLMTTFHTCFRGERKSPERHFITTRYRNPKFLVYESDQLPIAQPGQAQLNKPFTENMKEGYPIGTLVTTRQLPYLPIYKPSPSNSVGNFFPRTDDSHCDVIHTSLIANLCFDEGYGGRQALAWRE